MKRALLIIAFACLLCFAPGCRSASDPQPAPEASRAEDNPTLTSSPAGASTPTGEVAILIAEGRKHFEEYRNDEAVQTFTRAVELDPENGEARYRLGLALADAEKKEEAAKEFEKAVDLFDKIVRDNDEDAGALRFLALSYTKLDKHVEAVKAYRQLVRLEPDDSYNHYELGMELTRLAQYPEAAQALTKAKQLDPDNYRAAEALDRAREGVKRRDLAVKKQEEEFKRLDAGAVRPRPRNSNLTPPPPRVPLPSSPPPPPPASGRPPAGT